MPRRNQHTGTSEPLLATVSQTTLTDVELVQAMFDHGDQHLTVDSFMKALVDSDSYHVAETAGEAEHRLRQLTAQGWLYMSAYRDPETNVFIEYRWVQS